ncbi:REP-associated tyrosine transposase [Vibrio neonatus]|uniref:REP-associated tyrosine transposase n=1 Tax=Vibrio neonatus TaxID=278860 RepID=UPI0021C29C01|nr:transposase [Vibrio neonatus]
MRLEFSGALYHITSRGNERKCIYASDEDFELFLDVLGQVCEHYNWVVHAYCLMSNHYHLLLETPDGNLSQGMRHLNGVFTQSINRKHKRVGHLFQGRYKAILVDKENYLLELCRYIVLNPLRAKMVENLDEWQWSSWHHMLGNLESPDWLATDALLCHFSRNRKVAIKEYIQFVANGRGVNIWQHLQHQVFLGSDHFVQTHQALHDKLQCDLQEVPLKQRRSKPKPLPTYEALASNRSEAMSLAYRSGGYTLKQIANYFNVHCSIVSRIVRNQHGGRS